MQRLAMARLIGTAWTCLQVHATGRQSLLRAQENRNAKRREQELRDVEVMRYFGEQR